LRAILILLAALLGVQVLTDSLSRADGKSSIRGGTGGSGNGRGSGTESQDLEGIRPGQGRGRREGGDMDTNENENRADGFQEVGRKVKTSGMLTTQNEEVRQDQIIETEGHGQGLGGAPDAVFSKQKCCAQPGEITRTDVCGGLDYTNTRQGRPGQKRYHALVDYPDVSINKKLLGSMGPSQVMGTFSQKKKKKKKSKTINLASGQKRRAIDDSACNTYDESHICGPGAPAHHQSPKVT